MAKKKPKGWRREKARHSLAAKGIKSTKKNTHKRRQRIRAEIITFYQQNPYRVPAYLNILLQRENIASTNIN